jgi:hypothetical protein
MGSVRDAGQWPGTIARETAKYRGMNALFNGAARYRLSHPDLFGNRRFARLRASR